MDNTTAIIYARVSTEDQVEKYGLPSQIRACREYAAAHGLTVIEEITDDGISGVVLQRPGLDKVREKAEAGEAAVILMYDVDRLSRELAHLLILKPEIEKKARLEFVAAKFEDSPSGRMFFGIRGVVSQFEREQLKERLMRGKRERARSGLIVGGRVAYGYRYDAGKLIPHDVQSHVVRNIFDWYLAGMSIRGIGQKLKEEGIVSWHGTTHWARTSVRRILQNETYAGMAHYGTFRREGKSLRVRNSFEHRLDLHVPSLVTREQWQQVQAKLALNPHQGRPSDRYLLRGLLFCGVCGCRMYGDGSHGFAYRCTGRDKSGKRARLAEFVPCRQTVSVRAIDSAVWKRISDTFTDERILRCILAKRQKELEDSSDRDQAVKDLVKMKDQLAKLRRREALALEAMLDPELSAGRDVIKAEYRRVQQQRSKLEWEIGSRELVCLQVVDTRPWLDSTTALLREYIPTLNSNAQKQEFLRGLITRADWDASAQEVKLACLFGAEMGTTLGRSAHNPQTDNSFQVIITARVA